MAQSYLRSPTIQRLPELLDWLQTGELQIPSFQRAVVWTGEQRLSLCDTIMRGLPMGSVMVWRTTRSFAIGGFSGPFKPSKREEDVPSQGSHQYLLDGQQRLVTIFGALGPALWTREDETVPWQQKCQLAPDRTSWRIGYDLTEPKEGEFVLMDEADSGRTILPLDVLLDDSAYDDWREDDSLTKEQKNVARKVRSAFVDYLIPVVPLATDDLAPVTLTFKRVNSGGTSMGDFDMVRALSWTGEFDLETVLEEKIKPDLEALRWESLDRETLLKIIATIFGMPPGEIDWEKLSGAINENPDKFTAVGESLNWAVALLREIGFCGPKTLPYSNILLFVVRVWHVTEGELPSDKKRRLKTWLVEAAVTARFGGAPPHIVNAAWRELCDKMDDKPIQNQRSKRRHPRTSHGVNFRWARSVLTTAVLAEHLPRASDGTIILSVASKVGFYGKDWYRKLLPADGNKNMLFRSAANRVVCDPEDWKKLEFALRQPDCDQALLESHAITSEASACLVKGDKIGFLEARFERIVDLENEWLERHGSDLKIDPQNEGVPTRSARLT